MIVCPDTLPETNITLKMDGWNTTFLLGMAYTSENFVASCGKSDMFLLIPGVYSLSFEARYLSNSGDPNNALKKHRGSTNLKGWFLKKADPRLD